MIEQFQKKLRNSQFYLSTNRWVYPSLIFFETHSWFSHILRWGSRKNHFNSSQCESQSGDISMECCTLAKGSQAQQTGSKVRSVTHKNALNGPLSKNEDSVTATYDQSSLAPLTALSLFPSPQIVPSYWWRLIHQPSFVLSPPYTSCRYYSQTIHSHKLLSSPLCSFSPMFIFSLPDDPTILASPLSFVLSYSPSLSFPSIIC